MVAVWYRSGNVDPQICVEENLVVRFVRYELHRNKIIDFDNDKYGQVEKSLQFVPRDPYVMAGAVS